MPNSSFEKSDKIYYHDRIINRLFLWAIPRSVTPNHLTAVRFILTPFVVLLMFYENYSVGFLFFLLVAFTDALDGSLARTRDQITAWGKIYDPLADKILIGSMVYIIVLRYIDFWTAMIIIILELAIVISAWIRKREGRIVQSNIWGKIKMILQVAGVSILLLSIALNLADLMPFASTTFYLAIAFAIVSLLTYGI